MARALENRGWRVLPPVAEQEHPYDFTKEEIEILAEVRPFSMVSDEGIVDLCRAVKHVERRGIPGAIVECGVYRGGCMMAVALTLQTTGATRECYLFDTFEGMSAPTEADVNHKGEKATSLLAAKDSVAWARGR